jgi:hypothetical protein
MDFQRGFFSKKRRCILLAPPGAGGPGSHNTVGTRPPPPSTYPQLIHMPSTIYPPISLWITLPLDSDSDPPLPCLHAQLPYRFFPLPPRCSPLRRRRRPPRGVPAHGVGYRPGSSGASPRRPRVGGNDRDAGPRRLRYPPVRGSGRARSSRELPLLRS